MVQETLSEREKQVAAHLAAGLRVAGVARELGLAENTVRNHLKNTFSKLDVHSQTELIEFLRQQPETVSPYQVIAGLPTGTDRSLIDELGEIDNTSEKRIEESAAFASGLEGMRRILRAALPLDEDRRHEWRVRLAAHVVGPQQRSVREATSQIHAKWAAKPIGRIEEFQKRGFVRSDLDPEDVRRRLFSGVYAAVLALLANSSPEEERRQLATIDRLLEEIAVDGEADR